VNRSLAIAYAVDTVICSRTYTSEAPPEWIERPARTFMNLLEVPLLFYVVVVLMLETHRFDQAQVALSWVFVGTRVAHAIVYIAFNCVPLRFAAYIAGCITLGVIWMRFATGLW
jgi:hypothetical protein